MDEGSRDTPVAVAVGASVCGQVATRGESFYLVSGLTSGSTHTVRISSLNGDAGLHVFSDTDFLMELDCTFPDQSAHECTLMTGTLLPFSVEAGPLERVGARYLIEVD